MFCIVEENPQGKVIRPSVGNIRKPLLCWTEGGKGKARHPERVAGKGPQSVSACSLERRALGNKHTHCSLLLPSDLCWCCPRAKPNQKAQDQAAPLKCPQGLVLLGTQWKGKEWRGYPAFSYFLDIGEWPTITQTGVTLFLSSSPCRFNSLMQGQDSRDFSCLIPPHLHPLRCPSELTPSTNRLFSFSSLISFYHLHMILNDIEHCFAYFKLYKKMIR